MPVLDNWDMLQNKHVFRLLNNTAFYPKPGGCFWWCGTSWLAALEPGEVSRWSLGAAWRGVVGRGELEQGVPWTLQPAGSFPEVPRDPLKRETNREI